MSKQTENYATWSRAKSAGTDDQAEEESKRDGQSGQREQTAEQILIDHCAWLQLVVHPIVPHLFRYQQWPQQFN